MFAILIFVSRYQWEKIVEFKANQSGIIHERSLVDAGPAREKENSEIDKQI